MWQFLYNLHFPLLLDLLRCHSMTVPPWLWRQVQVPAPVPAQAQALALALALALPIFLETKTHLMEVTDAVTIVVEEGIGLLDVRTIELWL